MHMFQYCITLIKDKNFNLFILLLVYLYCIVLEQINYLAIHSNLNILYNF